jgi:hypothetical protein
MSYSRLSLESEAAANNLPNSGPIRHHPNGLVTFSAPSHHPIYANTNGYRTNGSSGNTVSVNVRTNHGVTNSANHRVIGVSHSANRNLSTPNSSTLQV